MFNNKYDWCGCRQDRLAGIEDIEKGICKIKEGIKDIYKGLECFCAGYIHEGVKAVERGLCKIEKGLCCIMEGLKELEYDNDCRDRMEIKEAICEIKEGVKGVQEGLKDVCCRRLCEGIKGIQEGLHDIEQGLCELMDAFNDILNEAEMKKRHKYEMMDDMAYGNNKHCGCHGDDHDRMDFRY